MHIERIAPDTAEWQLYYANHIVRYKFAVRMLQKHGIEANIADAACGVGYGSYHLANSNISRVNAIDISQEAIKIAKTKFSNPEISDRKSVV